VKVLLDENLDRRLRTHLAPHEVFTAGFEVLITGDQTIHY